MSFIVNPGIVQPPLTAGAVAYGTGTSVLMTPAGSAGQALLSNGAGIPTWSTTVPSTTSLAGGSAGVVPYQSAANTTAFTTVGIAGQVLQSNATGAPTWTTDIAGNAANVTGVVAIANGGTGATSAANARTNLVAQETLVSGTNIKTVGGQSLLGSGNISVGSGTVTSVGITPGTGISVSGSPITSSGNMTVTNTGVTSLAAGQGIAVSGPTGAVTVSSIWNRAYSQAFSSVSTIDVTGLSNVQAFYVVLNKTAQSAAGFISIQLYFNGVLYTGSGYSYGAQWTWSSYAGGQNAADTSWDISTDSGGGGFSVPANHQAWISCCNTSSRSKIIAMGGSGTLSFTAGTVSNTGPVTGIRIFNDSFPASTITGFCSIYVLQHA